MTTALYPAEFVFHGHPDKLCDAIADALVQEAIRREPRALVGVEVAAHRDHVYLTGRIGCAGAADIDVEGIVRDVYRSAGYDQDWYPSPEQVKVVSNLCLGSLEDGEAEFRELSDDQAICVGYANDLEATNHLPVEQWLVVRLAWRLHALRLEAPKLGLGPDGKVLVVVREESGAAERRWTLEAFSCSLQQKVRADDVALHRAVRLAVEEELSRAARELRGLSSKLPDSLTVNGAGAFEVGGPEGDNGLSGKKLVADAYGPRVPIGGGAWSGKDFFKADRAGGLHARRLAKAIVRLGLAREVQVVLGWFPGERSARVLRIGTRDERSEKNGGVDGERLEKAFDLSLLRSGAAYPLDALIGVARWGHFADPRYAWEGVESL
jgi:S-adenosylmethionine synthetase